MEAYLDWQKKTSGIKLNDVIEEYRYVANGKSVKKGDFLTYVGEDVAPAIEPPFNAVALSGGEGAEIVETKVQGDIFPKEWTKVSNLEYVAEDGTILTGSKTNVNYLPNKACDNDIDTFWQPGTGSTSDWIKIQFTTPRKITKMKLYLAVTPNAFSNFKIQGSNNNEWVDLYTSTSGHSSLTEISLSNVDSYLYYRILITSTNDTQYHGIYEWQCSEYVDLIPSTEHNEQVKIARVYKILTKTDDILAKLYKEVKATVTASSESSSSDGISSMFDGNVTTGHCAASATSSYAKVEFEEPQKILKMKLKFEMGGETTNFTSMTVQGSNDDSIWTDLYTTTTQLTTLTEVALENVGYYKYYQLYCAKPGKSTTWVYEWQVSKYEVEVVG